MMKVSVVGMGYVGVPLAAVVASTGARVVGIDIDSERVAAINRGRNPLRGREPGLASLLQRQVRAGRLTASARHETCAQSDVVVLCVETPVDGRTHRPNLQSLTSALASVGPHLKRGCLVSIESTLAPGTMAQVVRPTLERTSKRKAERDFYLVHCPERVTAGKLLHNLTTLDRILGTASPMGLRKARAFYRRFVRGAIHPTDWTTAELVKTAENAYWDVQIAFANEIARLSEDVGVDSYEARRLLNTSPFRSMLLPGAGVGGPCVPKDPWLLAASGRAYRPRLIPAARAINDSMPRRMAGLIEDALEGVGRPLRGARVAVLGFAYRENTEDARNTPAKPLVRALRRRGADVVIHDPLASSERGYPVQRDLTVAITGADCLAIVTAHDAYGRLDLRAIGRRMRRKALVDGRNLFRGREAVEAGFVYRGIGKGQYLRPE